jgi:regulator of nonsense transcripts 2
VIPPKHALDCLEKLLRTFKHHDIDVACSLLVSCGRFLFRSADTHVRTRLLLDIMQKKRGLLYDERQQALIDNAVLYVARLSTLAVQA